MIADLIAAWRTDVDSEPMPQLVDLDTALAVIRQAQQSAAGGCITPLTCEALGCQKLCYVADNNGRVF